VTTGVSRAGAVYTVSVDPCGVVMTVLIGLGRLRVTTEPPEVTTGIEVSVTGTVVVVVPPLVVKTWEMVGELTTGMETVLPSEVTMSTEVWTDHGDDSTVVGAETKAELGIELTMEPDSVMTGELDAGVWISVVPPYGVVTVTVLRVGMWTVATDPCGVTTWTEDSQVGTVMVAVLPPGVKTWETYGELGYSGTETVPPLGVRTETDGIDGWESGTYGVELTNAEVETEVSTKPDSVMTGVVWEVAGVNTVVVPPLTVVTVVETGAGRKTVAIDPDEVTTSTEVEVDEMVSVVVPPDGVKTWARTGEVASGMVEVPPFEVMMVVVVDGTDGTDEETDETNSELETEVTTLPD
jgi:hypothetical protein